MPVVTLPDGSQRAFDQAVTVADVALDIGPGLAKAALAGKVNGELVDTSYLIEGDVELSLLTDRDEEGVEVIRHSTAHLLAMATQELFPGVQVTIGPVINDGFYYDFATGHNFAREDLEKIEKRMAEIVKDDLSIERVVMSREAAIKQFREMGENYKVEIIEALPEGEDISVYKQGPWMDLCRGPHVPSTGKLKAFKLMKVAGAYWRGDSNNEMLQRIYGTAWANKKELKAYVNRLEEAEKRDHRKLGKNLDLFHWQEEAPGMVFWHAKGWTIYTTLENYMRSKLDEYDYEEVRAPMVMDVSMWERSGHWDKYHDNIFATESEKRTYAIKPMNCPGHLQIYNQGLKSYRDLPYRMAEFGVVHRNEPSGSLHGLMRVRSFTQDDAHVFCTESQILEEVTSCIRMVYDVYRDFGFEDAIDVKLSTRPDQRIGSDAIWDKAEQGLADALKANDLDYEIQEGEGAFYGPKIEFTLYDCLDRAWQCGTIQLDFSMPGRLGAQYVDENGDRQTPVMIHRAILGSLERFIGILTEHYAGAFPTWLAPTQAVVANITDNQAEYAAKLEDSLKNRGFRVVADLRNEKIGFKIREHTISKVPYVLVVGDKEMETQTVAVRTRKGKDLGILTWDELEQLLGEDVAQRGRVRSSEDTVEK